VLRCRCIDIPTSRGRYSRFEGATIGAEAAGNFVDKFLGGDLRFKKLKELDLMDEAQLKMDAMMDEE
jgi:hypothetical protein